MLSDFVYTLGCQLLIMFPIWAVSTSGGYFWKLFRLPPHEATKITLLGASTVFQGATLVFCFIEKHQVIMQLGSVKKFMLKPISRYILAVSTTICALSVPTLFYCGKISREEALIEIQLFYPKLLSSFEMMEQFSYFKKSEIFDILVVISVIFVCFGSCFCFIMTFHMIVVFNAKLSTISNARKQIHKKALQNLLAQAATFIMLVIPLAVILIDMTIGFKNRNILLVNELVFTSHSSVNSFVMIWTVKEYRLFVFPCFYSKPLLKNGQSEFFKTQVY
ncbi:unnamed protein product [Caenorhabditis angaria]|uniref:Uncharacterized protein n=1 Tax=Caenorhabditis angaria TaxID=860376 RepID=A0A9P1J479_9PELO|nr:unnamed protein product [Caenorhabditis angaria]